MFFYMAGEDSVLLVGASEETIRDYWEKYSTFRYDFNFSFCEYLRENGIFARKLSPLLTARAGGAIDIDVCPN